MVRLNYFSIPDPTFSGRVATMQSDRFQMLLRSWQPFRMAEFSPNVPVNSVGANRIFHGGDLGPKPGCSTTPLGILRHVFRPQNN